MKTTSYVNGVQQALSPDFMNAWKQKQGKGGRLQVRAKRRYWNGAAFVYEATWQTFTMGNFVEVGNITWKLDSPLLNEFKTSSVPLRFKGSTFQMLPDFVGTGGFFAPDDIAPAGYEPYLTQFQVQFGYKIPSGSYELVNLFTGVAIDFLYDVQGGFTEITVSGNEALLQGCDAQLVSTPIPGGATTNTGGYAWTTNAANVGQITAVYDNGVLKDQGTDYTISGLSNYGAGAIITLTYAAAGAVTYDGRAWMTNKKIEELVTLLAQEAGIASYNINPVIFPGYSGSVTTYIGQFTGSNWASAWTLAVGFDGLSGAAGILTAVAYWFGGHLCFPIQAAAASTEAYGTWQWPMSGTNSYGIQISFISNTIYGDGAYALDFTTGGLCRLMGPGGVIASASAPPGMTGTFLDQHNWTVTRSADGTMTVFVDNLMVLSGQDNTYNTSNYFVVYGGANSYPPNEYSTINIGTITHTTSIALTMADFTGMTCYDAIQKLTKLSNYEFGFDADGALFFRSKTPANLTPVVYLNQNDNVSKIMDFRLGHADVINVAQVTYGPYVRNYDSSNLPEASPTSEDRYLQRIESEDYSDFLLAYDPIIAASRAQSLHDSQYRTRKRARIATKIIPFLDLSDVSSFSFYNNPRSADNIWGDPLEKWGQSAFGKPSNVLARNLLGKTIGMILDPNNCAGEIEVQEIL